MITYSKRRGRRSLAAILAAMLIASVLAVVAGSPAQAANTASEVRTPANERQFAGATRYETALALAKDFAEDIGGIGNVSSVFVASGESLIDAVAVSALAGDMNVPVVLTRSDELHRGVKNFIEDYGITMVYVLGGSAAVSDDVVEALKDLAVGTGGPQVMRIQGQTRYETATAIASKLNGSRSWCDSSEEAAVLVNGGDVSLAGATVIGPVANRLAVPVLLTQANSLNESTRDWIEANSIDHVVIVGSTDHVSDDVAQTLTADGVQVVERISGETPGALSVAVAEKILGDCLDDLAPVAHDQVALVNGWSRDVSPDAITAAPVLTLGPLVPILLVGETLPASVHDFLASTPEVHDGSKVDYKLLAIGGPAAVSDSVMQAAIAAAQSADALSVQITNDQDDATQADYGKPPVEGASSFTLRFSDRVAHGAEDNFAAKLSDLVEINDVPVQITIAATDASENPSVYTCDGATVKVTLANSRVLRAGDRIGLASSTLTLGAVGDKRTISATPVTVTRKTVDTVGPEITIVAVENEADGDAGTVMVTVTSDTPLGSGADGQLDADDATTEDIDEADVKVLRSGPDPTVAAVTSISLDATTNSTTFALTLADDGEAATVDEWKAGDSIVIRRGALKDTLNNVSPVARARVVAARDFPKVTVVYMSQPADGPHASIGLTTSLLTAADDVMIKADKDGEAAGVYGNDWSFRLRTASGWKSTGATAITVGVDAAHSRVVATIRNGTPTYGELKAALEDSASFAALFDVEIAKTDATETTCAAPKADEKLTIPATGTDTTVTLTGGITKVALEARFDGYIAAVSGTVLQDAVFADAEARYNRVNATTDFDTDIVVAQDPATFAPPSQVVRFVLTADGANEAAALPVPGRGNDLVDVPAATAATGYALADADAANGDENANGASERYITRSNSIKAP